MSAAVAKAKTKAPYFDTTVSVDVDVEIDPADLHRDGWHHESECGAAASPQLPVPLAVGAPDFREAVGSLHRQAHPGQHADPLMCREEPCRSLKFADLSVRIGRPA